jgi:hypothetical protein
MADPKEGRDRALQAEPSVAGSQRFLSEVEGLGFHTPERNALSRMGKREPLWEPKDYVRHDMLATMNQGSIAGNNGRWDKG